MLTNYIKIAFRHLSKHKLLSGVTLLCLVAGFTFSLLIGVYIIQQYSVNKSLRSINEQYLIGSNWKEKGMGLNITTIAPLAKTLKEDYPSLVKNYYRFNPVTNVVSAKDKFFQENIAICDTTLVTMYGFELLHGNKTNAFPNNNAAVITSAMALKLFGKTDVLGETITLANTTNTRQEYMVTAVLKDMPFNTINNLVDEKGYSVFVPFAGSNFFQSQDYVNDWNNSYIVGMLQLQPGKTKADLTQALHKTLTKYAPPTIKENLAAELLPLKNYHFTANDGAVEKLLRTLLFIALFILLMAIINFINISIGTSSYRLKEIGLRKMFGSKRTHLSMQFLIEAFIITSIAAIIALLCYQLLIPLFNSIFNTSLISVIDFSLVYLLSWLGLVFIVGLLAGIYPAFVLSSRKISHAVKGKINITKGAVFFRKSLLVTQFSLAIIVFICAVVASRQVSFFFNKDLGYNKEKLMVITAFPKQWDAEGVRKMETIRDGMKELVAVKDASISFEVPDRMPPNKMSVSAESSGTSPQPVQIGLITADANFASTYQLHFSEGQFFDPAGVKTGEIVINESSARALGLSSAIGKKLTIAGFNNQSFTIVGVIKNYNYSSLQQGIEPIAFLSNKDITTYRYLSLKLQSNDMASTIESVQKKWAELSPNTPFEYSFMEQRYEKLYQPEMQLKKATTIATALNMIVVLLGIFGVLSFTLSLRLKEISLRKVLGASTQNILFLFVKEYGWLLLLANLIAWPVAYWATDKWLQQYAYRIDQNLLPYIIVSFSVCLLTILLIVAQSFKTAISKPIDALRTE